MPTFLGEQLLLLLIPQALCCEVTGIMLEQLLFLLGLAQSLVTMQ
jgi:hypothetical protein